MQLLNKQSELICSMTVIGTKGLSQLSSSVVIMLSWGSIIKTGLWGKRYIVTGRVQYVKSESKVADANTIPLFDNYCTREELYAYLVQNRRISAVITTSRFPIDVEGISIDYLPLILYLPMDCLPEEGDQIHLSMDLSCYNLVHQNGINMVLHRDMDSHFLFQRLKEDMEKISSFLKVPYSDKYNVFITKNIKDLSLLTSQDATFAYKNTVMGLVYKIGRFRPDPHEIVHLLMYDIGDPPFLFVEGLATMVSDYILGRPGDRHIAFEVLAKQFLIKSNKTWIQDMFASDFDYTKYRKEMYYIAASFIQYLYSRYSIDMVIQGYRILSRRLDYHRNLELFYRLYKKELFEVEHEWLEGIKIKEAKHEAAD